MEPTVHKTGLFVSKNTSQQRGIPSCHIRIIYQPIIRADQQQSEGIHASCMPFYDQVTHSVDERKAVDAVYLDLTVSHYFHIPTQSQFMKTLPTAQPPKLIPRPQCFQ